MHEYIFTIFIDVRNGNKVVPNTREYTLVYLEAKSLREAIHRIDYHVQSMQEVYLEKYYVGISHICPITHDGKEYDVNYVYRIIRDMDNANKLHCGWYY